MSPISVSRSEDGTWNVHASETETEGHKAIYNDALQRYLNILDPAFLKAKEKSEYEFVFTLLRVRRLQDAGWDPYETSVRAIPLIQKAAELNNDFETERHLMLWLYGHILEAAEPFEILMNLIKVIKGERFVTDCFRLPAGRKNPYSPGEKLKKLKDEAQPVNFQSIADPFTEIWNRNLRNSIFHSDYSIYGSSVRTIRPSKEYSNDEFMILLNKSLAYHNTVSGLHRIHVESYKEPKIIEVHPSAARRPGEKCMVIVRKNYGIVGIKDALNDAEINSGGIRTRIGRFYRDEIEAMDADHNLAFLSERQSPD